MGKIVLLDDLTINQIAAGEVIERPASVVKELVENSIDAKAKNITIEIKNGGISYIRITDDGSGIMPDDMEIAFERHATSKIRQSKDLDTVKSMGFRGEALASIAAISKLELISKTAEEDVGYKIVVEGGDILDKFEEGASKGTTITVKELFFNTPVRYKFLKKDFTESGYIEDAVTRIALANPSVAIKLINSGKTVLQTTGSGKLEDVVYNIYGKEIAQNILPVDYEYEDMKIRGVIGKPAIARSNRTNQLFFVNNRYIKDKTLSSAAEQSFKGLVTIGKHSFLILNIDMDSRKVDVNVHPAKLEVRFQEEGKVFKAIYNAIKQSLLKFDLVPNSENTYTNETPNDILKNINSNLFSNKIGTNAWNLKKEENNKKEDNIPSFNEFKSTVSTLDSETRRKYIDELTQAKTPEEIGKKLADMTKAMANITDIDVEKEKSFQEDNNQIKQEKTIENTNEEKIEENNKLNNEANNEENDEDNKETITINGKAVKYNPEELKQEEINQYDKKTEEIVEKINTTEEKEESGIEYKEEKPESFEEMYKRLFGRDIKDAKKEYESKLKEEEEKYPISPISGKEVSIFDEEGIDKNPQYKFIGIAFKTYIILTIGQDLYILDQHAAHERIMYEKVKANYYSQGEKDSQLMLLPDIINLNTREMGIFKDNKEMFNKAGFVVDEFGDNTVKLTGVPEFCLDFDTKEIFLETLDEINTVARTAKQELENKFLATVACKAAVKAHMALSKEEVDSLMEELLKLPNPFTCPHGRPTVIKMSKMDIEKKFSRR